MPSAVKKKMENSAQNAWCRMALPSVHVSSAARVCVIRVMLLAPAVICRHGSNSSGTAPASITPPSIW
jgi:hypothetical protein